MKTSSGSKRLSHGTNGTYKGVDNSRNKKMQSFHETSDLRSYKEKDPGNAKRRHGSGKKGKRSY